jgi:hypothetical protein
MVAAAEGGRGMSELKTCPECGVLDFFGGRFTSHRCRPLWECRDEDADEDDWRQVRASDSEDAAEDYAQNYDSNGDYQIIAGGTIVVLVRKVGAEAKSIERFRVNGETVPRYYAEKLEPADPQEEAAE